MLVFNNRIDGLTNYKKSLTRKEKESLSKCFFKIQEYIKKQYMMKGSTVTRVDFQLHYNTHTHSYLVIDFNEHEVYLSHRDHSSGKENYFCKNENNYEGWKYVMCIIVIENWKEIKKTLDSYFCYKKNVEELCNNFQV